MTNDEKIAAIREVLRDYITNVDVSNDVFIEAICDIIDVSDLIRESIKGGENDYTKT